MTANAFGIAINATSAISFEVCSAIKKYFGARYLNGTNDTKEIRINISNNDIRVRSHVVDS